MTPAQWLLWHGLAMHNRRARLRHWMYRWRVSLRDVSL